MLKTAKRKKTAKDGKSAGYSKMNTFKECLSKSLCKLACLHHILMYLKKVYLVLAAVQILFASANLFASSNKALGFDSQAHFADNSSQTQSLALTGDALKDIVVKSPTRDASGGIALQTSPKMRAESRWLVFCMEKGHYLKMPVSELDVREFLREYMQNLDFFKLFFTAEDVQYFQDFFAPSVDILLRQGTLLPAFSIYERFLERANKRMDWMKNRLSAPLDLSEDETFQPDRSKLDWPANDGEADALWLKRLKFDIENQMLGYGGDLEDELSEDGEIAEGAEASPKTGEVSSEGEGSDEVEVAAKEEAPKTFEEKFAKAKEEVLKRYERIISNYAKADSTEIQEIYLNTLSRLYDPHSAFLSEYYLEEFDISVRNALVGIGAVLSDKDGYCVIAELMPGGPAEESKLLEPGDKIIAVGQATGELVDTIGMKLRKAVKMIRGKEGSKVRLLIESGSNSSRKLVTLVRREIKLTTKLARASIYQLPLSDKTVPIGVIDLPAFYGEGGSGETKGFSTTKDVEELLIKLKEAGAKGVVLDLRRNGGGFLSEAVDLAGLFIKTGPVLQVQDANSNIKKLSDENSKIVWTQPVIILVSRLSASATEIVAGALQNHQRALIVGDRRTHGKGTVQAVYHLENFDPSQKSAAKVTIQKWYLPNGDSIQVRGVRPDIVLPSVYDYLEIGEEYKDYALKWDSITPVAISKTWGYGLPKSDREGFVEKLAKLSLERQQSLEEFSVLGERINWVKKRQEEKEIKLKYETRETQLKHDEEFGKQMEKKFKELSKLKFSQKEFLLDSAEENEKKGDAEFSKRSKLNKRRGGNIFGDDDDDDEEFDVQLREALRIMGDWIEEINTTDAKLPQPSDASIADPVALINSTN